MSAQREDIIDAISHDPDFDVIVVGGGINGIGVYRDLALQGLRVLLVERNDYCSGCSAAPSRMIHGGLRYLENGEFGLVRESLAERDGLLRNAPHFVRPLPTTIPIVSLFSGSLNAVASFLRYTDKPANRGAMPIKFGLSLYDWITRKNRTLPKHRFRSAKATRRLWPALMAGLRYSATYYDAWISHPERLGLELIIDTMAQNPRCAALNYATLERKGSEYFLSDHQTGREYSVRTKAIVNATGAWLDESLGALTADKKPLEKLVSGTKGSHLILENKPLLEALNGHMMFYENRDGRVCIVFPYLGKVLAGSTDIRVENASRVKCEEHERDYILSSLSLLFPEIEVASEQIVFSYSGIRPLPRSDHNFTGRISRGHFTKRIVSDVPQFCMVGGKWTTFRAFAEQTTDEVLKELGLCRSKHTSKMPIGGGRNFPANADTLIDEIIQNYSVMPERAAHLAGLYGTRAHDVQAYCEARGDDGPIVSGSSYTAGEIAFLVANEFVSSLSDIVLRRTDLAITGQLSSQMIDTICQITSKTNNWNAAKARQEKQTLIAELQNFYGVSQDMLEKRNHIRSDQCDQIQKPE
jgi:glycerol-3-phosphate dehydrogenase